MRLAGKLSVPSSGREAEEARVDERYAVKVLSRAAARYLDINRYNICRRLDDAAISYRVNISAARTKSCVRNKQNSRRVLHMHAIFVCVRARACLCV